MNVVFADTLYWVARIKPNDQYSEPAKVARERLGNIRILTTDEVLGEFLTVLGKSIGLRQPAAKMVQAILDNPNVTVFPQSRDSFLKGLELYANRPDKEYSFTDCVSMNVMKSEDVSEVLSNDHHFEQEGFDILIKKV